MRLARQHGQQCRPLGHRQRAHRGPVMARTMQRAQRLAQYNLPGHCGVSACLEKTLHFAGRRCRVPVVCVVARADLARSCRKRAPRVCPTRTSGVLFYRVDVRAVTDLCDILGSKICAGQLLGSAELALVDAFDKVVMSTMRAGDWAASIFRQNFARQKSPVSTRATQTPTDWTVALDGPTLDGSVFDDCTGLCSGLLNTKRRSGDPC